MVITLLVGATEARAVNRFRVVGRDLPLSSVGNIVEIQADLDQDVYGFSLSFNFDETLLEIESINLGEDVARLEPEYNAGIIDNDAGTASWGVVFALSAESIDVKLDAGASRRVVELVVNVLATDEESTVIDLIDVGGNPGRRNVMTDVDGNSVSPDPTLSDGTINLTEVGPVIEGVFPTSGTAGTQLLVSGRNFDQAGLVVRLCDQEVADPELLGGVGSTIRFPAPPCGTAGVSVLEICTDFGCAQSVFVYEQIDPGTPFIRGNANNDATVDLSDAVFSITATPPTITVTSPNGSESWVEGSTQQITWNSTGTVGDVRIEYSTNNGGSWSDIIPSTSNDGFHDWTVPSTPSTQCLIRISEASDGNPVDLSDAVFSITATPQTITVTSPNGGESWVEGSSQQITWNSTGTVGDFKIEYSTNNGASWSNVVASTANDGSHDWAVPSIPSTQCLIRISDY